MKDVNAIKSPDGVLNAAKTAIIVNLTILPGSECFGINQTRKRTRILYDEIHVTVRKS